MRASPSDVSTPTMLRFAAPAQPWSVHRQDDNGNRFVVHSGLSQDDALGQVADFESRHHKQTYWVEPERE